MISKRFLGLMIICTFPFLTSYIRPIDYTERMNQLVKRYSERISQEKNIRLHPSSSANPTVSPQFVLSYTSFKRLELLEARPFFLDIAEGIKAIINEDRLIRPVLPQYPAGIEDFLIHITFQESEKRPFPQPAISAISLVDGMLYYSVYNPLTKVMETTFSERYQGALAIAKKKGDDWLSAQNLKELAEEVITSTPSSPPKPASYDGCQKIQYDLATTIADAHNLQLIAIGQEEDFWSFQWAGENQMNLEIGRSRFLAIYDALMRQMSIHPCFRKDNKLKAESIRFMIDYWDSNIQYQSTPYLGKVSLIDGKFHYFYANPSTHLIEEQDSESIQEARSL